MTPGSQSHTAAINTDQPWFVLGAADQYELLLSHDRSISHFYRFEADASNGLIFAVPDGCIDIVFDCDPASPSVRVCGTTLEARSVALQHQHSYFGVRFPIGVVPEFLDTRAKYLVGQEINLADLMQHADSLTDRIVSQSSIADQAREFQRFHNGQQNPQTSAVTDQALSLIYARKGNIQTQEIASATGWSRRTILRQFQEDLGLAPKTFCRIIRCQAAMSDINREDHINLSSLAYDLGFSDQSHFLKDFRRLVSITPFEFKAKVSTDHYLRKIHIHNNSV